MSNQESMHQEATINQSQEADVIISKIAELSQALEENNPSIATYVIDIIVTGKQIGRAHV